MKNKFLNNFWWLLFSLSPAIIFILFYIITNCIKLYRIRVLYDSDINWLLRTGEYIYTHNFTLPQTDIFSHTNPDIVWVVYQWLFEVILYLSYSIGTFQGLGAFVTIIFASTFLVLYLLLRRNNVGMPFALICLGLGAWTMLANYYARPAIITYLLFSCVLLLFNLAETKNKKFLYIIPFIFVLWANCHLGFLSGILLLGIYTAIQLFKYLYNKESEQLVFFKVTVIVLVLSFVCTMINPYGIHLYDYFINLASSKHMNNNINELLSPNFHKDVYRPILILMFGILFLSNNAKKVPFLYLLCLAISAVSTLVFVRNAPFFGIFASIVFAILLQSLCDSIAEDKKLHFIIKFPFIQLNKLKEFEKNILEIKQKPLKINPSFVAIIAFVLIVIATVNSDFNKKYFHYSLNYLKDRPVKAYDFVVKHKPPGKFFSRGTWGSYAIFRIPEYKVFIDTRFDMYGDEFFKMVHSVLTGNSNINKLVDKYDVNWIIVKTPTFIAEQLRTKYKDKWFSVYKDPTAQIFIRETKANREWFNNLKLDEKDEINKSDKKTDENLKDEEKKDKPVNKAEVEKK